MGLGTIGPAVAPRPFITWSRAPTTILIPEKPVRLSLRASQCLRVKGSRSLNSRPQGRLTGFLGARPVPPLTGAPPAHRTWRGIPAPASLAQRHRWTPRGSVVLWCSGQGKCPGGDARPSGKSLLRSHHARREPQREGLKVSEKGTKACDLSCQRPACFCVVLRKEGTLCHKMTRLTREPSTY